MWIIDKLGMLALPQITVFSKRDCHLCEGAIAILRELRKDRIFDLKITDISEDEQLFRKYFLKIPVILVDGQEVFEAEDIALPQQCRKKLEELVSKYDLIKS